MNLFLAIILSVVLTFIFDYVMYKREEQKAVEDSWKALNEKLEKEGKERWDRRKI